ncbi:MAG: hypothetical protein ACR2IK_14540 [Chloroflexota bacterium]
MFALGGEPAGMLLAPEEVNATLRWWSPAARSVRGWAVIYRN